MQNPSKPIINSKPLRFTGTVLVSGALLFLFTYLIYVRNSGEIVATAEVISKIESADIEALTKSLSTYRYYDLEFSPFTINSSANDLKVSIAVAGNSTRLMPKSKELGYYNYQKLLSPTFQIVDEKTRDVVFQKLEQTNIFGKNDNGYSDASEGKFNGTSYYQLGHIDSLASGTYHLKAQKIIFIEHAFLPTHKELFLEIKSGAAYLNIYYMLYAVASIVVGGFILFLTAKDRSVRWRKQRRLRS